MAKDGQRNVPERPAGDRLHSRSVTGAGQQHLQLSLVDSELYGGHAVMRIVPVSRRWLCRYAPAAAVLTVAGPATLADAGKDADTAIIQPAKPDDATFIERAFEMRRLAIENGDQAYGAVIVRDNVIVGQSWSRVVLDQDPTGHAEISAIRDAAHRLGSRSLSGAIMYSSSRPCPMCEAAAYWADIDSMIYGRNADIAGAPRLCG